MLPTSLALFIDLPMGTVWDQWRTGSEFFTGLGTLNEALLFTNTGGSKYIVAKGGPSARFLRGAHRPVRHCLGQHPYDYIIITIITII